MLQHLLLKVSTFVPRKQVIRGPAAGGLAIKQPNKQANEHQMGNVTRKTRDQQRRQFGSGLLATTRFLFSHFSLLHL